MEYVQVRNRRISVLTTLLTTNMYVDLNVEQKGTVQIKLSFPVSYFSKYAIHFIHCDSQVDKMKRKASETLLSGGFV